MNLNAMAVMLQDLLGLSDLTDIVEQIRLLQNEMLGQKHELEIRVQQGQMRVEEFAKAINQMLMEYVPWLAEIIGIDYSEVVFGVMPGGEVYLLDVEIASRED